MLKRVSPVSEDGAMVRIADAKAPAPFVSGLEYGAPARGVWNIVHVGMLIPGAHEIYVCAGNCLRGVVLTAAEDLQMLSYLNYHVVPFTAVLTKGDKLSKMKLKEQKIKISAKAGLAAGNVIATAAADGTGKTEILQKTAEILEIARAKQNASEETEEDEEAEKELTNRRET